MQTSNLILVEEFCNYHKISFSFIDSLQQIGLVEITAIEQNKYIPESELSRLEQYIRLYADLHINLEGIDAITHLLDRMRRLQAELSLVKNRLSLYEDMDDQF
jgi:chaperone modulatory protein CbpM